MTPPASAATPLAIGDSAPPLFVDSWLSGPPAKLFEPGRIYVVEFWATWCGPCIANIPQLTALQRKYAGQSVTVIGATSPDDWGNTEAAVRKIIEKKGTALGYSIAWLPGAVEAKDRGIHRHSWFRAAGVDWLPTAFVVDGKGRIAFIGDPMLVEDTLEKILEKRFDVSRARALYLAARGALDTVTLFKARIEQKDRAGALALGRKLVAGPARQDPRTMLIVADALSNSPWKTEPEFSDASLAAAQRAVDLTRSRAPGMLDLLAHVYFVRGDLTHAVESEALAVSLSEGPMLEAQKKNLADYRAALEK
ncbi:MAG: TlpA disulfide reductase family protein [Thermoanaerobaculia bacterium]